MTWFEDDSKGIPEKIKNMSREELDAIINEFEQKSKRRGRIDWTQDYIQHGNSL
jgi:hypothetical protein